MVVSEIELYELLSQQLGADKAKTLVKYVEGKVDRRLEENTKLFATKEDIANLKTEMAKLEGRIGSKIYMVGLAQYLAIIASLIALIKFML